MNESFYDGFAGDTVQPLVEAVFNTTRQTVKLTALPVAWDLDARAVLPLSAEAP